MPDIFDTTCGKPTKNITIVCGDSFNRTYTIENALEVVFQSPSFNYQIPLLQDPADPTKWVFSLTSQQTQVIESGSYQFQIRVKYSVESIKTFEEAIINFLPSIFPLYKTYPTVIKETNPEPTDNIYGVPTVWYNKDNQTLWVLESNISGVAVWRKTSNLHYIYQTAITENFKFEGDTSVFSFIRVTDGQNLLILPGVYNPSSLKTEYSIALTGLEKADFYLYADKEIENKEVLGTFDQEIDPELIIYRYTFIKDSLESVAYLTNQLEVVRTTLSQEQLDIITALVNQMITDAQFPDN